MSARRREIPPKVRLHQALSSPVRVTLLEVLRGEPDLDTAELAQRLDLHVNTVRTHLGVLDEAGLVEPVTEERDRPGRPRLLYRATTEAEQIDEADAAGDAGYRFLATILASYLGATSRDPVADSEEAGRAWGSFVVDPPAPFARLDPAEAVDRLVTLLDELGFEPQVTDTDPDRPRVLLRRCPFLDVAREHEDVVCSIHLGLMRGALEQLDAGIDVEGLIPWAEPDGCVTHLRVGAPGD